MAKWCPVIQQSFVKHLLCSHGLVESFAKPFLTCHHTGSIGMTNLLSLCPCQELHIPTGMWASLMPHSLGWALTPSKFFQHSHYPGFLLWMDDSLGNTLLHLEHLLSPSCSLLCQPGHIGPTWVWTLKYAPGYGDLKYAPVHCLSVDTALTIGWKIILCKVFLPVSICQGCQERTTDWVT